MRIVLVTEFYYPHLGGVTEHVHHLAGYLARSGHSVKILTSHVAEAPRLPDIEHVRQGGASFEVVRVGRGVAVESNRSLARVTVGWGFTLGRKVRAALRGADVCHVHSPLFPMLPYLAVKEACRLDIPTVGTFHTHFDAQASAALGTFHHRVRDYVGALDRCIAVSPSAARSAAPFVDAPWLVIPNGIDAAAWGAGQPRPELAGTRNIVFLGRLDPRNDAHVLVREFSHLADDHPDTRLILVGDGPHRASYEAMVPRHLRPRVVFAGSATSVAERADYLASATVVAFTARIVSHPMALIEAMAAGRAVVAYDIEGNREILTDGKEGYRVDPDDPAGLRTALGRVLDNPALAQTMGESGRARVAAFDWSRIGFRIERVYRSLVHTVGGQAELAQPTELLHETV